MKRSVAFAFLLVIGCAAIASAQNYPTPYVPCFSSAGASTVHFNFEVGDSLYDYPSALHRVFYRDQSSTTWNSQPISLLYEACTTSTYSGEVSFIPDSELLEWYLRSENDSAVVTQSPKNSADVFPPPDYLMADLGYDSIGDAQNADGNFSDIVRCQATYSDTKLYFSLQNNGGGFPQSSGLFTYYVYLVGMIDPDAADSSGFAAIYANVIGVITSGLYKIDLIDSSFTKIGNISSSIVGNSLNMSCNIADLTADPSWSTWPPPSGFIGIGPVTMTQRVTTLQSNDIGKPAIFLPISNLLDYSVNTAPSLTGETVEQLGIDTIAARIVYTDAEDNLPIVRKFICESDEHEMTACVKDYAAGTYFEYFLQVPEPGWYRYHFEFSDGAEMVNSDLDSIRVTDNSYVPGDADGNGIVNIADAVALIGYIFGTGAAPDPLAAGDANCDGVVNISDAVHLIAFIFGGGPAPCS